mmetsp:Transcript_10708/g.21678  ORF Transcript_10708/g.21678 Transcript_10708/m.21678 type:complete len:82 (-) Transcript_10708:2609-2854(-)
MRDLELTPQRHFSIIIGGELSNCRTAQNAAARFDSIHSIPRIDDDSAASLDFLFRCALSCFPSTSILHLLHFALSSSLLEY